MITISKIWIWFSIIISFLVLASSLLGIFNPVGYSQETSNWVMQAVGQDIGNLLAVLIFFFSTVFLVKKSWKAYLIWLGCLLYFIYAFMIYSFFIHFNYLFLVYVAVLGLSMYTLIGGLWNDNKSQLVELMSGKKNRLAGIVLVITGLLFGFMWLSEIILALVSGQLPQSIQTAGLWVNPVQVIDLSFVLPGMILTGIFILRRNQIGYLFSAPWLTFSILMGSSIVVTMIMEINKGNLQAFIPLAIVGSIVLLSLFALNLFLWKIPRKNNSRSGL